MDATRQKIEELTRRINELARQQTNLGRDLVQLLNELEALKKQVEATGTDQPQPVKEPVKVIEHQAVIEAPVNKPAPPPTPAKPAVPKPVQKKSSATFEEFVGKNLASKIGILVTIIGVFIGAKYAIDHDLVKPVVRIIAGYISGAALIAIAIKLKKKYTAYSAVLMGGGIAVLYFITFIAYSFYNMFPQGIAFTCMLIFTIGCVYASLWYNQVIIAHLGLVGAYAIPFLLSNNSGRFEILFTYVAIINAGILFLSFRKYWKSLFYAAFVVTWLIYAVWMAFSYNDEKHFQLAFVFLCIFFVEFYITFLAYKLIKKEQYGFGDVAVLLSNAFIFYGMGYGLLVDHEPTKQFPGLFTVINAVVHLITSQVIRKLKLADTNLYYFVLGLVFVFLTIAIPVQLDGNWVTLLWTAEAVLVFIIGRTRQAPAYSKLGVGLVLLSFFSLLQDWFVYYTLQFDDDVTRTWMNSTFLTGILVLLAQGTIIYINRLKQYRSDPAKTNFFNAFYDYAVPVLLIITGYLVFQLEIVDYFKTLREHIHGADGSFSIWGGEVNLFSIIIYFIYALLYAWLIMFINQQWVKSNALGGGMLIGATLLLFLLLIQGLPILHVMTSHYRQKNGVGLYFGNWNLWLRYIAMALICLLLFSGKRTLQQVIAEKSLHKAWTLYAHVLILAMICSEYLHWTTLSGADNQFKLGLSILWGLYALFLIILGIRNKQKFLRLAAIILFFITLIKLFVYDLSEAGTITKTISFISLGVILLLVSYLYNRYKEVLFGEDPREIKNVE